MVVTDNRRAYLCLSILYPRSHFSNELGERAFILSTISPGRLSATCPVGASVHTFCRNFLDLTRGQESRDSRGWQLEEQTFGGAVLLLQPQLL